MAKKASAEFLQPLEATLSGAAGQFFGIMLDDQLRVHPNHFPITAGANSIEELRLIGQHNGTYGLLPRQAWHADLRENKDLVSTMTGRTDDGAIYQLTRIG